MSSLIVVHDSRMILLELAVENLYMPWADVFDSVLLQKTVIMFRMLDDDWTTLMPNRRDYRSYQGSNYENEKFYGGRSVLFSLPESALEREMSGVDLQLYIYKAVSKYFELEPRRNYGFTLVRVDDLFNGIIKDLRERKWLEGYFSSELEREPISRSTRGTFNLLNEELEVTRATIELYVRISYLGKCIVTQLHTPTDIEKVFYAREETDEHYRYQMREVNTMDLESFCWGSATIIPALPPELLTCRCKPPPPVHETTQTKEKKKKPKRDGFWDKIHRIQELIALMKEMRNNRPEVLPHGKPTTVCPPQPCVCPTVCAPVCVYTLPAACNPCQPSPACCLPSCT
ncbi:uncharacterized protein LOC108628918 [Ceratina calcarata]|uniref:Uncharacterized protein LOC108628918 n=1 Tax=Ceratina calcarata TaxID=156304 RepID=A0AAJ7J7Y9_9HYME|nr:uncharacterized protein LOC108628918 [Ceratina calcarata]